MPRTRRAARSTVHFDFAPMVDVVLVLLLFFLTAAILARPNTGFPVELPTASGRAASSGAGTNSPVVTLNRDGRIGYRGRNNLTPVQLTAALRATLAAGGTVVLEADRAVNHGRVVAVMDAIKGAGASRLSIGVKEQNP